MSNIDKKLENLNHQIYEKLKNLKILLQEKTSIMERYKLASPAQKVLIEKEMLQSKEKFEILSKEVDFLTDEITKLKNETSIDN